MVQADTPQCSSHDEIERGRHTRTECKWQCDFEEFNKPAFQYQVHRRIERKFLWEFFALLPLRQIDRRRAQPRCAVHFVGIDLLRWRAHHTYQAFVAHILARCQHGAVANEGAAAHIGGFQVHDAVAHIG